MVSTSCQYASSCDESLRNREMTHYTQSQVLLTALRNQDHPQHQRCWAAIAQQVQHAFHIAGRPLPDLTYELEYLRRDLENYDFQSQLKTWLMVRIARCYQLASSTARDD
jgi:hypothetical protein